MHIGKDIGGKERKTLVLIGAIMIDVVFERSQGFGPAWAPNDLNKLLDMFNARMYNGQIMWKEQEHLLLLMKDVKAHDVAHLTRTIVEFLLSFFCT